MIHFKVSFVNDTLKMSIQDDGKGFDVATVNKGNGLDNMQRRAGEAGAVFEMTSGSEPGTLITQQLKIPQ